MSSIVVIEMVFLVAAILGAVIFKTLSVLARKPKKHTEGTGEVVKMSERVFTMEEMQAMSMNQFEKLQKAMRKGTWAELGIQYKRTITWQRDDLGNIVVRWV